MYLVYKIGIYTAGTTDYTQWSCTTLKTRKRWITSIVTEQMLLQHTACIHVNTCNWRIWWFSPNIASGGHLRHPGHLWKFTIIIGAKDGDGHNV